MPICGATGGPTGVAPGPGYEGRPEPGNTPVPGYKDNSTILDITQKCLPDINITQANKQN